MILFGALIVPLIYILGILSLSSLSIRGFNEVILYQYFPVQYTFANLVEYLIKPITVISGTLLTVLFPGLLFAPLFFKNKERFSLARFFSVGFVINVGLLFLGTTLLKICGIAISRFWFIATVLIGTLAGLCVFFRASGVLAAHKIAEYKKESIYILLLICIIIGFVLFFHNDVLSPLPVNFDYSEKSVLNTDFTKISDFHEEFGIPYYLKTRILPYWLIKSLNRFGIYLYQPQLSYFLNFFAMTVFGESYAAMSFLALAFSAGIFLFIYKIICMNSHSRSNILSFIVPAFFMLSFLLLLRESTRRPDLPFMSWPETSVSNTIDCFWIFAIVGMIFFLCRNDSAFSFLYACLATLCKYESILCVFILATIYYYLFKENRVFIKRVLKLYVIFLILFGIYSLVLCVAQKGGASYLSELLYDRIFIRYDFMRNFAKNSFNFTTAEEPIWAHFEWAATWKFIKLSLLSTYFFIVLFLIPTRDRIGSFLSAFCIIFLLLMVTQSMKLSTYALMLVPLSAVGIRRFIYPSIKMKLFNMALYIFILFIYTRFLK